MPRRRKRGAGSIFIRGDGRIGAVLPSHLDPARRPIYSPPGSRRGWTSEAEAAAWLDGELDTRRHPPPAPLPADELLGVYCYRWWQAGTAFWPTRTARAYRRSLALILGANELDAVPVGRLTHEAVRTALAALMSASWQRTRQDGTPTTEPKPYARRTVQHARMALGLALSDLVPDVLQHNPVTRARLPRMQPPAQPVWDGDQADRFLQEAERLAPHLALAFRLILRRALRRGEVLALQWRDVDERRSVLTVERTVGERAGQTGDTKGRRRREIPLSADLIDRLRASKQSMSPWIFTNPETNLPYHPRILSWWVPQLAHAAGVPVIQPKDMRATCATNLLDQGWPLPRVAALLGHASIATTASHYARAISRREDRLAQMGTEIDVLLDAGGDAARAGAPAPIRRADGL
jgi:integrase